MNNYLIEIIYKECYFDTEYLASLVVEFSKSKIFKHFIEYVDILKEMKSQESQHDDKKTCCISSPKCTMFYLLNERLQHLREINNVSGGYEFLKYTWTYIPNHTDNTIGLFSTYPIEVQEAILWTKNSNWMCSFN